MGLSPLILPAQSGVLVRCLAHQTKHTNPLRISTMLHLHILLAWLLMAAVPMQGFAAASMLFCGKGVQHVHAAADATTTHDHSMHAHAGETHHHASTAATGHKPSKSTQTCSNCAACCNSVAIMGLQQVIAAGPAPQSQLAEPLALIQTRPSTVPDKPPRA